MKLSEIVEPKPTGKELYDREIYNDPGFHGPLGDGEMYVAANQKDAVIANIIARFREMGFNPKHFSVHWSSPRQASAFPPAEIRMVVTNRKSELFTDKETETPLATTLAAVVKNAFREVFGFKVVTKRENFVSEYSNGFRYLDYKVTPA